MPSSHQPENHMSHPRHVVLGQRIRSRDEAQEVMETAAELLHERIVVLRKFLEESKGMAAMLTGSAVVIDFVGSGEMVQPKPVLFPPDWYRIGSLTMRRFTSNDHEPIVWLQPIEHKQIIAYGAPVNHLELATPADINAYAKRQNEASSQ